MQINKVIAGIVLLGIVALVVYDSLPHFDADLVNLKRAHRSAQGNWNVHYDQRYVFNDSSVRYQNDFNEIKKVVQPGNIVLSDLATSYFLAASMPIYAKNVHHHQGRNQSAAWKKLLNDKTVCYLGQSENMAKLEQFVINQNKRAKQTKQPLFKYVVVNKDTKSLILRYDCLWQGRVGLMGEIEEISTLRYTGEYLNLYEFNAPLVETL